MGVLTIDEGGGPRSFRVGDGVLAVGSGEEADLQLEAPDVALLHADLEVEGESLFVVPKPGVLPPRIHGVELKGRTRLAAGQELRIGKAKLSWRAEGGEDPAPAPRAAATPAASPAACPAGSPTASPRMRPSGGSRPRAGGARGARPSRRSSAGRRGAGRGGTQGIPSWLIVVGVLAILGGAAFLVLRSMQGGMEDAKAASASFHLRKAEELIESLNVDAARDHLERIPEDVLTPDEEARYRQVEDAMAEELAKVEELRHNNEGDTWFEFKLEDYEERYLSGSPELPEVRLFLERCAEFRERWPRHPRLDWVSRQERRFRNFPGLDEPLGYEDVVWRAKVLTNARPRDYATALAMLHEFRDRGEDSSERIGVDRLIETLEAERAEYHEEQLLDARREYEKGNVGRAVEWLVQSILGLGDEAMENEAAEILIKFPGVESRLLGYREERPEDFEALARNEVIADFLKSKGIEPKEPSAATPR